MHIHQLTENGQSDLLITVIMGSKQIPITLLVDAGAQVLAIKTKDAVVCGIVLSRDDW